MSRIGKSPVPIADGVEVKVDGRRVSVKGKLGELPLTLPPGIMASVEGGNVNVARETETRLARSYHGLARSLVANMVEGVSKGFKKQLQIEGVGFRASVQGPKLSITLGFASPVEFSLPEGITVTEEGGTKLTVSGIDKQLVGETAARIRAFYPVEPYKGKGVRYADEQVKRKVGKTVA